MSTRVRKYVFLAAAAGFVLLFAWGISGLPRFGNYPGPYGDVLNSITVRERHVTDVVTAVNFDFRGFDTLGEEYILFVSVMGVLLLLRRLREEQIVPAQDAAERTSPPNSDAVRLLGAALVGFMVLFGIYTVIHGQLTPGGGFQGGVILATGPLLVYLISDFSTFEEITPTKLGDAAEALGAALYALIGAAALIWGAAFLTNVLPLGQVGSINSGGTIPLINIATGLEVTAGFVSLSRAFLQETYEFSTGGQK